MCALPPPVVENRWTVNGRNGGAASRQLSGPVRQVRGQNDRPELTPQRKRHKAGQSRGVGAFHRGQSGGGERRIQLLGLSQVRVGVRGSPPTPDICAAQPEQSIRRRNICGTVLPVRSAEPENTRPDSGRAQHRSANRLSCLAVRCRKTGNALLGIVFPRTLVSAGEPLEAMRCRCASY